ncbi:unnamed protein product [Trichogramma brassicae]|uniref:Peptidase S1 domain-containing protein n=1 Tax=Trichogramma brassicae TaxID=86971 RepID=A0A6H5IVM8_9HYME|nr:unnamed protein product [Trichogramma brassicae]
MARMLFDICDERQQQLRVNAQNKWGWTPLHLAIDRRDFMMTVLLMRKGGDPNLANEEGSTPLHTICAKSYDNYLYATALFDLSNEEKWPLLVDARDKLGDTPLHVALRNGHAGMVQLLLRRGRACPNLADDNTRTPLQLAVECLFPRLVDILLNHGADLSSFVFPTESHFDRRLSRRPGEEQEPFQLRVAADLLDVAARLENKGYNLKPSDVATIMNLFVKHDLIKRCDVNAWHDEWLFKRRAKLIRIRDDLDLSLYDLIKMPCEEAVRVSPLYRNVRIFGILGSRASGNDFSVRVRASDTHTLLQRHRFYCPQLHELCNQPCTVKGKMGICRQVWNCNSVYNDFLAGKTDAMICSFQGTSPIICCPDGIHGPMKVVTEKDNAVWGTVDQQQPTTSMTTPSYNNNDNNNNPGWVTPGPSFTTRRPNRFPTTLTSRYAENPFLTTKPPCKAARKMCSEYAKAVYEWVRPPTLLDENTLVNRSTCAITSKKLIVGGKKASPREFPHMALVGYLNNNEVNWRCGGSLISDRFVLTAAHCTYALEWGDAEWVRLGVTNMLQTRNAQDRRIVDRIKHPKWKASSKYYDIALLRLETPVKFNVDTDAPEDLLKVTVPVIAQDQCQRVYQNQKKNLADGIDRMTQFCAGTYGKDTCQIHTKHNCTN